MQLECATWVPVMQSKLHLGSNLGRHIGMTNQEPLTGPFLTVRCANAQQFSVTSWALFTQVLGNFRQFAQWPPAVESSISVEDAVENRGLYRVFVSRLLSRGFRHYSTTIARLSPPSGLERGG